MEQTYARKKEEYESIKKEKETINKEIHRVNKELEPTETRRLKNEMELKRHKDALSAKTREIGEKMSLGRGLAQRLNDLAEKMSEVKQDYSIKESDVKSRQATLTKMAAELASTKTQWEDSKETLSGIQEAEQELKSKEAQLRETQQQYDDKRYECTQAITKMKPQLEEAEWQLSQINSEKEKRLRKLREANGLQNSVRALQWLQANKHVFEGEVYEPMFLRINIKRPELAKYVENSIANRDLCSMFLFEKSKDLHLFVQEVREKQNLAVNTAMVPDIPSSEYRPAYPLNDIQ